MLSAQADITRSLVAPSGYECSSHAGKKLPPSGNIHARRYATHLHNVPRSPSCKVNDIRADLRPPSIHGGRVCYVWFADDPIFRRRRLQPRRINRRQPPGYRPAAAHQQTAAPFAAPACCSGATSNHRRAVQAGDQCATSSPPLLGDPYCWHRGAGTNGRFRPTPRQCR